ncbi:MAG TPA: hypothetical protein VJ044_15695, partial [Candidatus Hodarchaeales archaeon]|nr:hypothetical protein [Candidatus Hodarchaeales archaeon]
MSSEANDYQGYSSVVANELRRWGLKVWDKVQLVLTSGNEFDDAVILPRYVYSSEGMIAVKLKSGYNTGIRVDLVKAVKKTGESKGVYRVPEKSIEMNQTLPKVTIL